MLDRQALLKLKSGTDVRGVAVDTEQSKITLTDEAVYSIVRAFLQWTSRKLNRRDLKIALGNDVRISTDRIAAQVKRAARDSGCDLVYTGLCSTPSMFMLLHEESWDCDASIMITASHLPYDKNGLKFFTAEGGLEGEDITTILNMAADGDFLAEKRDVTYCERSYLNDYCAALVDKVRTACNELHPLAGKKIIVDAGNGAGGFFVDKVLLPLGADTRGSQFLQPDGTFPNHIPNPEDKSAMAAICRAVKETRADLGIIFDTDVDRAGAVDSDGSEINRNRLIALMAAILLKDGKGTVVTDSVTSDGLAKFIRGLGGTHVRFKRGYKNVIDEALRRESRGENCPLAMETSGHAALKENYFLDDGAYLITKILICLAQQGKKGQSLTSLISSLEQPAEADEVRLGFTPVSADFKAEGLSVIEDIKRIAAEDGGMTLASDNYEGVRVSFAKDGGDGWFLVRMSVHDPIMPINFESNTAGGNKVIAAKLYGILQRYPFLDTQKLKDFIG